MHFLYTEVHQSRKRVNAGTGERNWKLHLSELIDAGNLLLVSVSQISEEQLFYNP
jgi:hypothetical protein